MSGAGNCRRLFCPHCEESLAYRTYREHVRLYHDPVTRTWNKRRKTAAPQDGDEGSEVKSAELAFHVILFRCCRFLGRNPLK